MGSRTCPFLTAQRLALSINCRLLPPPQCCPGCFEAYNAKYSSRPGEKLVVVVPKPKPQVQQTAPNPSPFEPIPEKSNTSNNVPLNIGSTDRRYFLSRLVQKIGKSASKILNTSEARSSTSAPTLAESTFRIILTQRSPSRTCSSANSSISL